MDVCHLERTTLFLSSVIYFIDTVRFEFLSFPLAFFFFVLSSISLENFCRSDSKKYFVIAVVFPLRPLIETGFLFALSLIFYYISILFLQNVFYYNTGFVPPTEVFR